MSGPWRRTVGEGGLLGGLPKATPYESYALGVVTHAILDSDLVRRGDMAIEQVVPAHGELVLRMAASGKLVRLTLQEMTGYTEEIEAP